MNKTVGLYLVGYKGFRVLAALISEVGASAVAYVIAAKDGGVDKDYFQDMQLLAKKHNIIFLPRKEVDAKVLPKAHITFAVGWKWILSSVGNRIIFHDSLLPAYRGFAPLVNALIAGEKKVGVTALLASDAYDTGPIVDQKEINIVYPIKIVDAIEKACDLYSKLAVSVYRCYVANGCFQGKPQNEKLATYSPWRDEVDYVIPWSESSAFIKRFCNAVGTPYMGAKTYWGQRELKVLDVEDIEDISVTNRNMHIGKVIMKEKGIPIVICGSGLIMLRDVRDYKSGRSVLNELPFRVRFTGSPR